MMMMGVWVFQGVSMKQCEFGVFGLYGNVGMMIFLFQFNFIKYYDCVYDYVYIVNYLIYKVLFGSFVCEEW